MRYAVETIGLTKEFTNPKGLFNFLMNPFYRKGDVTALKDVNIQVYRGEIFGLMGPSGAGKTTLLKVLSTLILPTGGSALVNGYDIVRNEYKVRCSIGLMAGDQRSLYWRLTGRQNLEFYAALHHIGRKEAKKRIGSLICLLRLDQYVDRQVMEYSAGMRQKLILARSLFNDAEILFMDEPTKSLDVETARNLRDFIKKELVHRRGKTVLFTTHQLDEAEFLSDRLAIMDRGGIERIGKFEEVNLFC